MSVGDLTPSETALVDATVALTARLDVRQTCRAMLDIGERLFAAVKKRCGGEPSRPHPDLRAHGHSIRLRPDTSKGVS